MSTNEKNGPAIAAGIFSGLIFGIYWIFLRQLESYGFQGISAVFLFNLVPFLILLPFLLLRWRSFFPGRWRLHLGMFLTGLGYVTYASAFLYTEVVKAIALFYLLPIWGFLIARLVIGEPITSLRWTAMGLAITGMAVLFSQKTGIPLPQNPGDYMALISGVIWALGFIVILTDKGDPITYTLGFFFWATLISLLVVLIVSYQESALFWAFPTVSQLPWWILPLALLVLIPAAFCTLYAPSKLNPGVTGLLFMTEISVGVISAALFAGEPFGQKEILGVLFITVAGLIEPVRSIFRKSA